MASCAECVHVEVCRFYINGLLEAGAEHMSEDLQQELAERLNGDVCEQFLARDRMAALPCKVGDKVYLDNLHIKYADVIGIYIDAFGGVFDLRIYTNFKLANGFGYKYFISKEYTFEDIGKRIFLTKEAAEHALKGREEDEGKGAGVSVGSGEACDRGRAAE